MQRRPLDGQTRRRELDSPKLVRKLARSRPGDEEGEVHRKNGDPCLERGVLPHELEVKAQKQEQGSSGDSVQELSEDATGEFGYAQEPKVEQWVLGQCLPNYEGDSGGSAQNEQ